MGYTEETLTANERIVHKTTLHPLTYRVPFGLLTLGIILIPLGRFTSMPWLVVLGISLVFICPVKGIGAWVESKSSEFVVTNKRIIIKIGLISRKTIEMNLTKIEAIVVNQGVIGRLINSGTIVITGTGGTGQPFKNIDRPLEFRKKALEQIDGAQERLAA